MCSLHVRHVPVRRCTKTRAFRLCFVWEGEKKRKEKKKIKKSVLFVARVLVFDFAVCFVLTSVAGNGKEGFVERRKVGQDPGAAAREQDCVHAQGLSESTEVFCDSQKEEKTKKFRSSKLARTRRRVLWPTRSRISLRFVCLVLVPLDGSMILTVEKPNRSLLPTI